MRGVGFEPTTSELADLDFFFVLVFDIFLFSHLGISMLYDFSYKIIDALCGRVSKTVLARHYTDYSPDRLKRIYDKANLKILS